MRMLCEEIHCSERRLCESCRILKLFERGTFTIEKSRRELLRRMHSASAIHKALLEEMKVRVA